MKSWRFDGKRLPFQAEDRERIRDRLIASAEGDPRIVSAAAVGSTASGGDRWSDVDLTFGVSKDHSIQAVVEDWTAFMEHDLSSVQLFDLPYAESLYRVFLTPDNLQIDLSFTPQAHFGAIGPRFKLLFGRAKERSIPPAASAEHLFGLAVHHAVRAAICIERGKLWQAEHWIHSLRDEALSLACIRSGLAPREGRGFDDLPEEVKENFIATLVGNMSVDELRRALKAAIGALLVEASYLPACAKLRHQLETLC